MMLQKHLWCSLIQAAKLKISETVLKYFQVCERVFNSI